MAAPAASAAHLLPLFTTGPAALGLIGEPALGVSRLIISRVDELAFTIDTDQGFVSVFHGFGLRLRAAAAKISQGIRRPSGRVNRKDAPKKDRLHSPLTGE
jgi:hypothetical protein